MNKGIELVIVSDNHGKIDILDKILKKHPNADCYIHCGDAELPQKYLERFVMVQGNNDYFANFPESKVINLNGNKILVMHGHQFLSTRRKELLTEKAKSLGCKFVCYGHSHVPDVTELGGVHLLNPGSLRYNRDGSKPSYLVVFIENETIDIQLMRE